MHSISILPKTEVGTNQVLPSRQPEAQSKSDSSVGNMNKKVLHFHLHNLMPDTQKLALNLETRTLSLLSDGPQLVAEQQLSANELHMIVPILEFFPYYCPYEVLFAHLTAKIVTSSIIDRSQQYLREAQDHGNWLQELRPVRRAISSLRNKLVCFHLSISTVRERGCSLTGLTSDLGNPSPLRGRNEKAIPFIKPGS